MTVSIDAAAFFAHISVEAKTRGVAWRPVRAIPSSHHQRANGIYMAINTQFE
jgi:hypothetical protein